MMNRMWARLEALGGRARTEGRRLANEFEVLNVNFYRLHLLFLCVASHPWLPRSRSLAADVASAVPDAVPDAALTAAAAPSIVTPLVLAAIAYASNGRFPARYVDLLFCCVSAMTGTGLATLDLSALTAWQQAILVVLQLVGSPVRRVLSLSSPPLSSFLRCSGLRVQRV